MELVCPCVVGKERLNLEDQINSHLKKSGGHAPGESEHGRKDTIRYKQRPPVVVSPRTVLLHRPLLHHPLRRSLWKSEAMSDGRALFRPRAQVTIRPNDHIYCSRQQQKRSEGVLRERKGELLLGKSSFLKAGT